MFPHYTPHTRTRRISGESRAPATATFTPGRVRKLVCAGEVRPLHSPTRSSPWNTERFSRPQVFVRTGGYQRLRLEKAGLVEPRPDADSTHLSHIYLIEVGPSRLRNVRRIWTAMEQWLTRGLSIEERNRLSCVACFCWFTRICSAIPDRYQTGEANPGILPLDNLVFGVQPYLSQSAWEAALCSTVGRMLRSATRAPRFWRRRKRLRKVSRATGENIAGRVR